MRLSLCGMSPTFRGGGMGRLARRTLHPHAVILLQKNKSIFIFFVTSKHLVSDKLGEVFNCSFSNQEQNQ